MSHSFVESYGREVEVKAGSVVKPDGWRLSGRVVDGDDFCPTRLTTNNQVIASIAARVEVTGRTFKRMEGEYWVRVRITVVNDGEPDATMGGYMLRGW